MNNELKKLYKSKWDNIIKDLSEINKNPDFIVKPANPLLMRHKNPEGYQSSDIRVLILGQETNTWGGQLNPNLEKNLEIYENWYGGGFYKKNHGHFKNHFNLILSKLNQKFPDKQVACLWSNVLKVGKSRGKGMPPNYILTEINKNLNILQDEIDIIRPNLIIFLCSYKYDNFIKQQLQDAAFFSVENYNKNQLSEIMIPNVKYSYRTYHPKYLNFQGRKFYSDLYNKIVNELKFN